MMPRLDLTHAPLLWYFLCVMRSKEPPVLYGISRLKMRRLILGWRVVVIKQFERGVASF